MTAEWVVICTTSKLYQAEMVKSVLDENDIGSYIVNKQDSAYLIGDIEVYVSTEDAFRAKQILISFQGE